MVAGWLGGPTTSRIQYQFNGDLFTYPIPIAISPSGGWESLAYPGVALGMVSGPAVPYVPPPRWQNLSASGRPNGEGTGFLTQSITLTPTGSQGSTTVQFVPAHGRVTGVLLQPADTVFFTVPNTAASNQGTTVAIWSDFAGSWPSLTVYARCGAKPTASTYHVRRFSSSGAALLDLTTASGAQCTSLWYIAVSSSGAAADSVFHARVGQYYTNYQWSSRVVGSWWSPTTTDRNAIRAVMREAAWKLFGMTGQSHLLRSFTYQWGSCSGAHICWRDPPNNCGGIPAFAGRCNTFDGSVNLCWGPPVGGTSAQQLAAALVAHEFGHCYAGLVDEYWTSSGVAQICGDNNMTIARCTHSTMSFSWWSDLSSLCNARTHDNVPDFNIQTLVSGVPSWTWRGTVRGQNTISECADGVSTNYAGPYGASAWDQIAGRMPTPHSSSVTPDNYHYRQLSGSAITDIGRNLN
ncbi:MAG: hypothetical protein K8H88_13830 [Sandaracinaceae bacterium]|nr:hypothetical protein [Sandaracinaceae bacterium]